MESLSEDLRELLELARTRDLSLGEIAEASHRRGVALLICLLTIPFLQPIPLPVSPFIGAAIAVLGFRLAMGRRVWLPGFVLRRQLHSATLVKVFEGSIRVALRLEKVIRPRMNFMDWPGSRTVVGLHVVWGALALAMPIVGLPFSNGIPAIGIVLLALGWMERDGVAVIGGALLTWVGWVYFALSGGALFLAFQKARDWFAG